MVSELPYKLTSIVYGNDNKIQEAVRKPSETRYKSSTLLQINQKLLNTSQIELSCNKHLVNLIC